jgi:putative oxidoreductase
LAVGGGQVLEARRVAGNEINETEEVGMGKSSFENVALTALRIFAGLAYFSHGAQKVFGWFGGMGPNGGGAELMSRFGAAGMIEVALGTLLIVGLFTRAAAFLASGEMAVTYFWMHAAQSHAIFWWANRGELPMLYAFIWLYFAARGAGAFSLDAVIGRKADAIRGGERVR